MENTPIQISHDRLVSLKLITENQQPIIKNQQKRYFIYEIDGNKWQNINPNGEPDADLELIKQEKTVLPIGILTVDENNNSFSFEGDLTVTTEDQTKIFAHLKQQF
ncbi:MAG: hypothetical protein EOP42_12510 [Sphingobacteriaceae bacterium]|nr:MAG: hypothetical protein EOP42_12510 [Sphingobacteriaceae bacterium]